MKALLTKHAAKPIALATLWIGLSEFVRNQLLFANYWVVHYEKLGLTFPAAPINGMVWMLWSCAFAATLYILSQKFTLQQVFVIGWWLGFVMMWLVIGNLGVLPYTLLIWAIPLSILETYIAVWLIFQLNTSHKIS